MWGLPPGALSFFFFAASSSSNNSNLRLLEQRLDMAFEVSKEAEEFLRNDDKPQALSYLEDALNMGRKSVITLTSEPEADPELVDKAQKWLIQVLMDSSDIRIQQEDWDGARRDAWAACVFSNYATVEPLETMVKISQGQQDNFGEYQALQQLLQIGEDSLTDAEASKRKQWSYRLEELTNEME